MNILLLVGKVIRTKQVTDHDVILTIRVHRHDDIYDEIPVLLHEYLSAFAINAIYKDELISVRGEVRVIDGVVTIYSTRITKLGGKE